MTRPFAAARPTTGRTTMYDTTDNPESRGGQAERPGGRSGRAGPSLRSERPLRARLHCAQRIALPADGARLVQRLTSARFLPSRLTHSIAYLLTYLLTCSLACLACLLASLPTYLLTQLLACSLACFLLARLACLLTYLFIYFLTYLPSCFITCLLACLPAYLPT